MDIKKAAEQLFAAGVIDAETRDATIASDTRNDGATLLALAMANAEPVDEQVKQASADDPRFADPTKGMSTAEKNKYWAEQSRLKSLDRRGVGRPPRPPQQVASDAKKLAKRRKRAQRQARRR